MNRYRFVLLRPLQLVPVLIGISLVSFLLIHALPGDPVRTLVGMRAPPDVVERIRAYYGLDQPVIVQYFYFLRSLAEGELGRSVVYRMPVSDLLASRAGPTLFLLVYATLLGIVLTIALSVTAARNRGRWPDQTIRAFSTIGLGFPSFWIGLMLILVFSVRLGLFPVSGAGQGFVDRLHHLFLPAFTIALALSAVLTRTLRASLIEQMDADHVTAARSRGVGDKDVFWRHVVPNSLIPTINLLGVNLGWLISGTVVVETVFSVPGLGFLMTSSIFARDYMTVQAITLVFALATVLITFLVDVVTVALDPRVRM
ncbi:MAG: ABC transporter permease [Rubellimicrobium sp.]|nr:ABC transporter permease [Rubellimicrobium sp.]